MALVSAKGKGGSGSAAREGLLAVFLGLARVFPPAGFALRGAFVALEGSLDEEFMVLLTSVNGGEYHGTRLGQQRPAGGLHRSNLVPKGGAVEVLPGFVV